MVINKKFLQFFAALWILVFHLWIPVSGTQLEQYLVRIGYVGVDVFFFLSAYSLADKKIKYGSFILDRFLKIYLKFILFVLVAAVYKKFAVTRVVKIVFGIELFERGGGAFLWFLPAIMIFYLLYPLFLKITFKYKTFAILVLWFVFSIVMEKAFGYTDCFIFTNRIPIVLAGYLLKKYPVKKWIPFVCLPIGLVLMYYWGNAPKLNVPIKEFYYILAIPLVIGLAGLSTYIKAPKLFAVLGSATMELYALQMIFGSSVVTKIYKLVNNKLITDIIMLIVFFGTSILIAWVYNLTFSGLKKIRVKRT